ncbi:MAG: calcium/sodium antiporter [Rubripirellula sp.]|nr:calcium/sodium antiporter [Rubripirellula sp.]
MWLALQIIFGFVLLVGGGESLVRGAARIAAAFKISPLVIGLTVVAFGTSAPELGVSLQAAFAGKPDVAIGNVVGSNITNVLLVLGTSALVAPLIVSSQLIRLDVPLMIAASLCVWGMGADGNISRVEGAVLFGILVIYIAFSIWKSRSENKAVVEGFAAEYGDPGQTSLLTDIALIVTGLALLTLGAGWLVDGAVTIAASLGVSELVISLTVIAVGTSLPEVVTSVVASYRGERDIAVGNVVGSNLFNLLCVLGLTSAVSSTGVSVTDEAIAFDMPVMVAVAVICLPIFWLEGVIRRHEGAMFLSYYLAYTTFLVLSATLPAWGDSFGNAMEFVVVPATLLTLGLSFYHARKKSRQAQQVEQS